MRCGRFSFELSRTQSVEVAGDPEARAFGDAPIQLGNAETPSVAPTKPANFRREIAEDMAHSFCCTP